MCACVFVNRVCACVFINRVCVCVFVNRAALGSLYSLSFSQITRAESRIIEATLIVR